MPLKILCAGGSKEDKEAVETAVRAGIGARPAGETWTVSLVEVGRQWSVTLDGPEKSSPRSTFIAGEGRLREAISQSLAQRGAGGGGRAAVTAGGAAVPTGGATAVSGPAGQRRNSYTCLKCGKAFVVSYDVEEGEGEQTVPAACPHCWQIEDVKVGITAAANNDYRVDKA